MLEDKMRMWIWIEDSKASEAGQTMASVFQKLNFVEKLNKLGPKKGADEIKEVILTISRNHNGQILNTFIHWTFRNPLSQRYFPT